MIYMQYRCCRLFLPIPITTDCSSNRHDYTYGRCIGTALLYGPRGAEYI